MKKYHVISAKNFGYESLLGDGIYDYFIFPAEEFSESEARGTFEAVTKETLKPNNRWYSYTAYEYLEHHIVANTTENNTMKLFTMDCLMKTMFLSFHKQ